MTREETEKRLAGVEHRLIDQRGYVEKASFEGLEEAVRAIETRLSAIDEWTRTTATRLLDLEAAPTTDAERIRELERGIRVAGEQLEQWRRLTEGVGRQRTEAQVKVEELEEEVRDAIRERTEAGVERDALRKAILMVREHWGVWLPANVEKSLCAVLALGDAREKEAGDG